MILPDAGGDAMASESGSSEGGNGGGFGPGGNAYTGAAGPSHGGDVINRGGVITNTDASKSTTSPCGIEGLSVRFCRYRRHRPSI